MPGSNAAFFPGEEIEGRQISNPRDVGLHFYAYLSGLKECKDVKRGNLNITIMRLKNGAIPGFILVFSLLFATTITTSAQEMKEAVDLYNFAAQNFKTESAKALDQLKQCEALCEKIEGEEVGDLKSKVQKLYPMIYFEVAKVEYRGKHYAEAVAAMEDAKRTAEAVDDRTTIKNVDKVLPGIYYNVGLQEQTNANYEKAVSLYQQVLNVNKNYVLAYVAMAICQDSLRQHDAMLETITEGVKAARMANNLKVETDLRYMGLNYLKRKGQQELDAKQVDSALATFGKAIAIDERDAEIYLAMANIYSKRREYDRTVEYSDKALANAPGTMNKNQIFFLKAQALAAKGDVPGACESYKEAAFGEFKEAATHQMKELKCK